MIVRPASGHDVEHVLALIRRIPRLPQWRREALAIDAPAGNPEIGPVRRLLVATDGVNLLGFAQVAVLLGEAELESMAVEPEQRGQGIGRLLLASTIEAARSAGATLLRLEVRRSNQAALRLYRSAGLTVTGERRGYYRDPVEDALLLQLSWAEGV